MNPDRRSFLQNFGVGALGALALSSSARAAATGKTATAPLPPFPTGNTEAYWRAVRAQFPLLDNPTYLNVGGLGPTPQPVLDKVFSTMLQLQEHSETGYALIEPARETLARYTGVKPHEICFTRNATEATSIIAAGLKLREGDEVIFESHAHPGGSFTWYNQANLRGVKVKIFVPDNASPAANLARISELVTPRTRVIQVSHITCTTGLVMPVREIAAFAAARGIWFHIDGAQSVGMIPVNFAAIGCDSFALSGHKWLGGPHETGLLYLRHDRTADVAVPLTGAHAAELPYLPGELKYAPGALRHEYGTRNAGLIVGLAEAVQFQERIGIARIAAHGRELATRLFTEISRMDGIIMHTPGYDELRSSMTTFSHPRADAQKFFTYLLKSHQLRCRPVTEQKLEAVRVSTHIFNSHAECERVIAGVRASLRDL